jgi:hypothetical protein
LICLTVTKTRESLNPPGPSKKGARGFVGDSKQRIKASTRNCNQRVR